MMKLTWGQVAVLVATATPMAAVGVAGAVATFANMDRVLHSSASALGMVAAGEGATLIAALVALSVTLMGQHTPAVVRVAMWALPLVAAGAGVALAPDTVQAVTMGVTPLAMTAAGEGVAFVARRVVAFRTGIDIEQQRRSGLLLWHANRAANGKGRAKARSERAVWRLTKQFAETDGQLSVQLGEIQRYRISDGADTNLAAVLGAERPSAARTPLAGPPVAPQLPELPEMPEPPELPELHSAAPVKRERVAPDALPGELVDDPEGFGWIKSVMDEAAANVVEDPEVRLMTVQEVADLRGVSAATVRSWKHRGRLRVHDTVDGSPRFHPMDVSALD